MASPFTLRFVLADGRPDLLSLADLWEGEVEPRPLEDDMVGLFSGQDLLVRLDVQPADSGRGRALLRSIAQEAARFGTDEAIETVGFVLEHASGLVIAQPILSDEDDVERALEPLDTLWEHLFTTCGGLLQVDGEGLYVEEGPVVELP